MKLILLLALTAISGLFMLVNSFSQERSNLFPAAAILLLTGGILLTGAGLQTQEGTELSYTTVDNSTVIDQKTPVYQTVDPFSQINFSNLLGMLYMIIGAGYAVMAAPGRFRTILSPR